MSTVKYVQANLENCKSTNVTVDCITNAKECGVVEKGITSNHHSHCKEHINVKTLSVHKSAKIHKLTVNHSAKIKDNLYVEELSTLNDVIVTGALQTNTIVVGDLNTLDQDMVTINGKTTMTSTTDSTLTLNRTTPGTALDIIIGDVILQSGNVTLTDGDVTLTDGDVNLTLGNVTLTDGDVNLTLGNVTLTDGDVTLTTGNINLTSGNVTLTDGDVTLTSGNVTLTDGDVTLTSGNATLVDGNLTLNNGYIQPSFPTYVTPSNTALGGIRANNYDPRFYYIGGTLPALGDIYSKQISTDISNPPLYIGSIPVSFDCTVDGIILYIKADLGADFSVYANIYDSAGNRVPSTTPTINIASYVTPNTPPTFGWPNTSGVYRATQLSFLNPVELIGPAMYYIVVQWMPTGDNSINMATFDHYGAPLSNIHTFGSANPPISPGGLFGISSIASFMPTTNYPGACPVGQLYRNYP
jgi:hypothetical protein